MGGYVTIVDRPGHILKVLPHRVPGITVCTRCRGGKTLYAWGGWSDIAIGRPYFCPQCDGRGYWNECQNDQD